MGIANIGRIEALMFIEYIRNYIDEQLGDFCETNARGIEHVTSGIKLNALFKKQLCRIINLHIVQPYIAFMDELVQDINGKLYAFFGLRQTDLLLRPQTPGLFHYQLNGELIAEYGRTETISTAMEKLIDKTLDFACLDRIQNPAVKKFIDPLSVGSLLMGISGLDSSSLGNRHRQELCRALKGIGKNINRRAAKLLITRYTALMHQKMEEIQTPFSYEQAI